MNVPGAATSARAPSARTAAAKATAGAGAGLQPAPKFNPLLDLLDEAGVKSKARGPACPNCATEMSPTAVICVQCGYNVATGERLQTHVLLHEDDLAMEGMTDAEKILAKAEKEIDQMPVSSFGQDFGEGNESYLIAIIAFTALMLFVGAGVIVMMTMDRITEWIKPETISLTASLILTIGCMTYVTIVAFIANPTQGILCVCTAGLYCIFFAFAQGKSLIVAAIVIIGSILIGIVSLLFMMYGNAEPVLTWLPSAVPSFVWV